MYDQRYEDIFVGLMKNEGGFADHPDDRGGPTNFGITKPFLTDYLDGVPARNDDIANLTIDDAHKIYHKMVWQRMNIKLLPGSIQPLMFHWVVMSGPTNPIKYLQAILDTKGDGIIGPKTAAKARDMSQGLGQRLFVNSIVEEVLSYFIMIVQEDHSQAVFLRGWFNRMYQFHDFGYPE